MKCPIILLKRNHVTGLIVKYYHKLEGHQMGLNYTINHVREKYLVVHVREQVKRVMREYFECARRFQTKPAHQQMAPLPKIRLQQSSRPSESCAVDFGGPFLTKQGRGRVRAKRYLCFSVRRPIVATWRWRRLWTLIHFLTLLLESLRGEDGRSKC